MLDFKTSTSNSEVLKSNSWKITSSSKTTLLQREPFLTKFYTINSSSITRYQVRFYANNYFLVITNSVHYLNNTNVIVMTEISVILTVKCSLLAKKSAMFYILTFLLYMWQHLWYPVYVWWLYTNYPSIGLGKEKLQKKTPHIFQDVFSRILLKLCFQFSCWERLC